MLESTAERSEIRSSNHPTVLAKLDQRTKEARLMRETRAELIAHVGGKPSAVQSALIERACQLTLRIATMDRRFVETGAHTDHDSRQYLAWSNSLGRTLKLLGMKAAAERAPTLAELMATHPVNGHTRPASAAPMPPGSSGSVHATANAPQPPMALPGPAAGQSEEPE